MQEGTHGCTLEKYFQLRNILLQKGGKHLTVSLLNLSRNRIYNVHQKFY